MLNRDWLLYGKGAMRHNKPTKKKERNAITVPWPLLGRLRMYWGEILYIGRGLLFLSPYIIIRQSCATESTLSFRQQDCSHGRICLLT